MKFYFELVIFLGYQEKVNENKFRGMFDFLEDKIKVFIEQNEYYFKSFYNKNFMICVQN